MRALKKNGKKSENTNATNSLQENQNYERKKIRFLVLSSVILAKNQ